MALGKAENSRPSESWPTLGPFLVPPASPAPSYSLLPGVEQRGGRGELWGHPEGKERAAETLPWAPPHFPSHEWRLRGFSAQGTKRKASTHFTFIHVNVQSLAHQSFSVMFLFSSFVFLHTTGQPDGSFLITACIVPLLTESDHKKKKKVTTNARAYMFAGYFVVVFFLKSFKKTTRNSEGKQL